MEKNNSWKKVAQLQLTSLYKPNTYKYEEENWKTDFSLDWLGSLSNFYSGFPFLADYPSFPWACIYYSYKQC